MDQMSVMLMLDQETSRATDALAPHKSMLDPNDPRSFTSNASIPKPVSSTISSYLADTITRIPNQEQLDFTKSLAIE